MIRLWERGLGNKYRSYMALQIHDEILFNIYEAEKEEVFKIIWEEMTREQTITSYLGNKWTFSVPIDAEAGTNWGSLEPFDLKTGQFIEKESKH